MISPEMKYEFLITYESIASGAAPGFTNRDISAFLTESEEDIVKELYSLGMDKDDKSRMVLNSLKVTKRVNLLNNTQIVHTPLPGHFLNTSDTKIFGSSKFFLPYVESAFVSNRFIEIKPVELNSLVDLNNPFKKPSASQYWRILVNNGMLIVPPKLQYAETDELVITYIKKPDPIIVANLLPIQAIDGVHEQTNCKLNEVIHRDIVYRAAKKAFAATQNATGYQIQNTEERQ